MKLCFSNVASIHVLISLIGVLIVLNQYRFLEVIGAMNVARKTSSPTTMPFCSREQVQHGFWTAPNRSETSLPYRSTPWEETCYKNGKGYYPTKWNVHESCQLVPWDPVLLCDVLENKTLGFLGDSISWQIFRSMVRSTILYSFDNHSLNNV